MFLFVKPVELIKRLIAVARESMQVRNRPAAWSSSQEEMLPGETLVAYVIRLALSAFGWADRYDQDNASSQPCSRPILKTDGLKAELDLSPNSRRIELVLTACSSGVSLHIKSVWQGRVSLPETEAIQKAFITGLVQTSDYAGLGVLLSDDPEADYSSYEHYIALGRLVAEYDGRSRPTATDTDLLGFVNWEIEEKILKGKLTLRDAYRDIIGNRRITLRKELEALYAGKQIPPYLASTWLGRFASALRVYNSDLQVELMEWSDEGIIDLRVIDFTGSNVDEGLGEFIYHSSLPQPLASLCMELTQEWATVEKGKFTDEEFFRSLHKVSE